MKKPDFSRVPRFPRCRGFNFHSLAALAIALAALLGGHSLQAATFTWDGDTSSNWDNSANWDALPASANDTVLVFNVPGLSSLTNNNLANPFIVNGMTFGTSMTVSGQKIDFQGTNPFVNIAPNIDLIFNNALNFGATTTFRSTVNATNTSTIEFKGLLSGGTLRYANNSPTSTTPYLTFKFSGTTANTMNGFTLGDTTAGRAKAKIEVAMDDPFGGAGTTLRFDNSGAVAVVGIGSARTVSSGIYQRADITFSGNSLTFKGNQVNETGGARVMTNNMAAGQTLTLADGVGATFDISRLTLTGTGRTVINGEIVELTTNTAYKGIRKQGTGTLVLNGKSSMGSATGSIHTVSAGTLQFGKQISFYNNNTANWTADRLLVSANATAAFNVGGTGEFTSTDIDIVKGLGGAADGFKDGSNLGLDTSNAAGGDFTYSSVIANTNAGTNSIGLAKLGSNRLTLTNTNTYTGATSVSAGSLAIDGTGSINPSSGISVAAGAKLIYNSSTALTVATTLNGDTTANRAVLSGSGPINITLTLDNVGDTLAPGNSPGIMNVIGSQSWESFSYDWEVNNFTGLTAGTDFDRIAITGSLGLTGTSGSYILNVLSLTAGNNSGDVPNFSEIPRSWTVLSATGGITGFDAANWTINTSGFTNLESGLFTLGQSGNDLVLSYTAVPEAGAALLGGLGTLVLLRRRRR